MPKAYEADQYEDDIYAAWEKSGFFNPDNLPGERKESFTIVLPPPNVTGVLHMGHAAMLAIEDIMIRFERMRGKKALWLPGTDHAAIATQTKVEKLLIKDGMEDPRTTLGRENFLEKVEEFASNSHDVIVSQAKKIGASLDWSREAYTLDKDRNNAVNAVFKMMYDDGLIYRGHRVINWCPRCKSTLADDELEHKEGNAKLYTFKYDSDFPISISTTRPETKYGDTAVAVHPDDDRYKEYVGKEIKVNFLGQDLNIQVVADKAVDMDFGTGALGVTPAHSHTDADMARVHGLKSVHVISEDGLMINVESVVGMTVKEARKYAVSKLSEKGLIEHEEDIVHNLSVCYRCEETIEPLPMLQWFIDVNKKFSFKGEDDSIKGIKANQEVTLKLLMQHVVRTDQINIIPGQFEKTYFHWIDNLRDWNISRQIWFGHRVPVWYHDKVSVTKKGEENLVDQCKEMIVSSDEPKCEFCDAKFFQDPDTLDTWFSSGIWTFSTLGWPNQTDDLKTFHPTNVLETGYDILFPWVARMILMTTYVLGTVPFKETYLHGLVRDEKGRKMSKSLGNAINPLEMIKKYGADATRLSLVIGVTAGNDSKLSESKIGGYRNFTNKLWNISRYVFSSVDSIEIVESVNPVTLSDKWVLSRLAEVSKKVESHLEKHEFSQAGEKLREFTWAEFADWYLEISKIQKNENTDKILLYTLESILSQWHPFMPFVTEQVYKQFGLPNMMLINKWPEVNGSKTNTEAETDFKIIQNLISSIRNIRAEYNVEHKKEVSVLIKTSNKQRTIIENEKSIVMSLAKVSNIEFVDESPKGAFSSTVISGVEVYVSLEGLIDIQKEKNRLQKEIDLTEKYISGLEKKLSNKEFLNKAPKNIVDKLTSQKEDAELKISTLKSQLLSF